MSRGINQVLTDLSGKVATPIKAIVPRRDGGKEKDGRGNVLSDSAAKNAKTTTEHMLHTLRYWDVVLPPVKKYTVGDRLVPAARHAWSEMTLGRFNKKRRITIELYKPDTSRKDKLGNRGDDTDDAGGGTTLSGGRKQRYFGPLLRGVSTMQLPPDVLADEKSNNIKSKITHIMDRRSRDDHDDDDDDDDGQVGTTNKDVELDDSMFNFPPLGDNDIVIFRILKVSRRKDHRSIVGDSSDDEIPEGDYDAHSIADFSYDDYGDGYADADKYRMRWHERYRSKIHEMEILKVQQRTIEVQMGAADDTVVRDIHFGSKEEANTFVKVFKEIRKLQKDRGMRMIASHQQLEDVEVGGHSPLSKDDDSGLRSRAIDFGIDSDDGIGNSSSSPQRQTINLDLCCGCTTKKGPRFPNEINLLVEIVSATDLPIADVYSSDPYVIVRDGRKEWHKTRVIQKSLNPVWCLSTGSLFLMQTTLVDFFESSNSIDFIVKDYDSIGEDEILGTVIIPKTEMLSSKGERLEYELTPHAGRYGVQFNGKKSYLALRFRLATAEDVTFMQEFQKYNNNRSMIISSIKSFPIKDGVHAKDAYLPPQTHPAAPLKRNKRPTEDGRSTQYRVKPCPDPERPEDETKWMTAREIETMAMEPSRKWIEAGSGSVWKIYLEILGCNDIPNLDFSITGRDKSDPFVSIAYEDVVVNTDVINDCLSPRWLPWTQRAFILNTMHPSSQIMIGVFDHDQGIPGRTTHDKIGRCQINLTNCRPDTVYTIKCHLYDADEPDREARGTILMRARIESTDQRKVRFSDIIMIEEMKKYQSGVPANDSFVGICFLQINFKALLHEFQLHTEYSVSFKKRSDYKCAYYALTNDTAHQTLSLNAITHYATELQGYTEILDEIVDAMMTLFLWRGHYPVSFRLPLCKPWTVKLPLHSITAFVWGIVLARDFEMIFSFLCFWVAWILLATMGYSQSNPSPWKQPRSYWELLGVLIFNVRRPGELIEPNQNIEAIMAYDSNLFERERLRKEAIEHARRDKEDQQRKLDEQQETMEKETMAGGEKLHIGITQFALAPFKSVLMPAQTNLYRACVSLRIASSIIMWRDSIAAFWIVTAALIASFVVSWIPWAFLFRWVFKIFVYVVLGPWMKIVDICYVRKKQSMTRAERQAQTEAEFQRRYDLLLGQSYIRRLMNERNEKLRDFNRYMFGKVCSLNEMSVCSAQIWVSFLITISPFVVLHEVPCTGTHFQGGKVSDCFLSIFVCCTI
jgi:hypothetical protein